MNKQVLKHFAVTIIAVIMLTGCGKPCEYDGTGVLKLVNKTVLRFTIKIDDRNYGQIEANETREYVLMGGESYVCVEYGNSSVCYKDFTVDIFTCEITTKELTY